MTGKNFLKVASFAVLAMALLLARPVVAQEHPSEHPSEHPTEAKEEAKSVSCTMEQLSAAIHAYVAMDTEVKGGKFFIYDDQAKKVLSLTLAKVHEDKLASLGDGVYFACADFNSDDKHVYDLDVFMKQGEDGTLTTTEVSVHKMDGEARYTWHEADGVWTKKVVAAKESNGK